MKKKGFTLSELMIAVLILSVGLLAILGLYISLTSSIQKARQLTIAAKDAGSIFEQIQGLTLPTIKNNKENSTYWNSLIDKSLTQETISVSNNNSTDTTWDNDPLELEVTVSWKDKGQNRQINLSSKFTDF